MAIANRSRAAAFKSITIREMSLKVTQGHKKCRYYGALWNRAGHYIFALVNFGLLTAEIGPVVWGIPANFNGFRVLAALLHDTPVLGVSQTLRR